MHPNSKSYKRAHYLSFLWILIPALVYQNGGIRCWGCALPFCKGWYLCVFARDVFSLSEKYSHVIRQHEACILGHILEKRKTLIFIETIERGLQVFVAVAQPESGSRAVFVQRLFSSWLNPNCKIQQIICIIKRASLHPLRCKTTPSAGYYYSSGCYFYVFPIPALYIVLSCSI